MKINCYYKYAFSGMGDKVKNIKKVRKEKFILNYSVCLARARLEVQHSAEYTHRMDATSKMPCFCVHMSICLEYFMTFYITVYIFETDFNVHWLSIFSP